MTAKQIQKKKDQLSAGEKAFNQLEWKEKTKIRICAKSNFYSQKCRICKYEFICAKDWKIET